MYCVLFAIFEEYPGLINDCGEFCLKSLFKWATQDFSSFISMTSQEMESLFCILGLLVHTNTDLFRSSAICYSFVDCLLWKGTSCFCKEKALEVLACVLYHARNLRDAGFALELSKKIVSLRSDLIQSDSLQKVIFIYFSHFYLAVKGAFDSDFSAILSNRYITGSYG
jgi:hypothetical protein